MKYLIPTDFSDCANYALQMGIALAKKNEAEIHLFHAIDDLSRFEKFRLGRENSFELKNYISNWTKEKIELLQREIGNHGIPCETFISEEGFLSSLQSQVEKYDYEAIVMGSHGVSGKEEWFIGSNTSKAVRKLHENIFVVKHPVTELDVSRVVFVTGLEQKEQKPFRQFLNMIAPLDVQEIHILCVDTFRNFSQPSLIIREALKDFEAIANDPRIKTHFYPDYSIQAGIRHFSQQYSIDLIAISNYVRHPLKRIFLGSNVEMLVNHSEIPVLSLDQKN